MPMAGCCCGTSTCRRSPTTPSPWTSRRRETAEATKVLGTFLRDVIVRNPDRFRLMGPDETASNRLSAVFEATDKAWLADIGPDDEHLGPDGRVMEVLSEHLCQGWLEGYLLTGRHGLFNCYEAFVHIVDSMLNQHAKWLSSSAHLPWRRPDRLAELSADIPCLASGPQRRVASGSRIHRPRRQQAARGGAGVPAAGRQHAAVGGRPLPAQPPLRQRDRGGQAARADLPGHGRGDRALHPRAGHLGMGRATPAASPMSCWPAPATSRRWRRWPPPTSCAANFPIWRCASINVVDIMRLQPDTEHPHGLMRPRVRRAVHHRQAGHLRLSRLSVADPPADLSAHQSRSAARARLQGAGHHDDAVRHGDAQRSGPVPSGGRCHRPGGWTGQPRGDAAPAHARCPAGGPPLHPRARRGRPRRSRAGPGTPAIDRRRLRVPRARSAKIEPESR